MLDYYIKKGQGYPIPKVLNVGNESTNQPKPPTEKYSGGWFDGLIGEKALYPENSEYWYSQKGVKLSDRV